MVVERRHGCDALEAHLATPRFRHIAEVPDVILAEPVPLYRLGPERVAAVGAEGRACRRIRLGRRISTGADPIGW
jgi:hypothetical protein